MLNNIFKEILSIQEQIISHINSRSFDQLRPQLNLLILCQKKLILSLRKTKFYKEFDNLFTLESQTNDENDELYEISTEDISLSKKSSKYSKNLKNYINSVIRNGEKLDSNTKTVLCNLLKEEHVDNRFISEDLETELHEVCDKVSFSMDIGGTFAKILLNLPMESHENYEFFKIVYVSFLDSIYFSDRFSELLGSSYEQLNVEYQKDLEGVLEFLHLIFLSIKVRNRLLVFKYFPVSDFENVIKLIKDKGYAREATCINFTGGGAYKHTEFLNKTFAQSNVKANGFDEFSAIAEASKFLTKMDKSAIIYDLIHRIPEIMPLEPVYPFIISSIGSGTFYLKVDSNNEHTHVFGTSISGGTSFGLVNYLLPLQERRSFIKIFKTGENKLDSFCERKMANHNSGDCDSLSETLNKSKPYGLCQTLGKFKPEVIKNDGKQYPRELYKSLIDMVAYNKGCLGYIVAKANGAKRLMYNGNFICTNTMDSIVAGFSFTSDVYRDKSIELCFPLHGPYTAALGSFLMKNQSSS